MRVLPLCIAMLMVQGCASMIMEGFVGKPVSAVVNQHGMPTGSYDLGGGERAFVWQKQSTYTMPGNTQTRATVVGNQVFASSYTSPGYTASTSCAYVLRATRVRADIDGPAAWMVTGFEKPRLECE